MEKKKILFVIESLCCGGAEKSLTCLLQAIDYSKYEVDLQLFARADEFERYIPDEVNFLEPLERRQISWRKKAFVFIVRKGFALRGKIGFKNNNTRNRMMWKYKGWYYWNNPRSYDAAIAYSQGMPTFYVMKKTTAKIKIAYKNSITSMYGRTLKFYSKYYQKYTYIVCVSEKVKAMYADLFPCCEEKMRVIYDINNPEFILALSQETVSDMFDLKVNLVTVGSLKAIKGYDLLIEAAACLKESGLDFCWYIIGEGAMRFKIEEDIKTHGLENKVLLLGKKINPYPYMAKCSIYISTSRAEGFGLTLAEAKILNKPVVSTNFATAYEQIEDGENGLIVEMSGQAIADGIMRLVQHKSLQSHIIDNLKHEKKGNTEEIEKFYSLIDG